MVAAISITVEIIFRIESTNVFKANGGSQKHAHGQVVHLFSRLPGDLVNNSLNLIPFNLEFERFLFSLSCCLLPLVDLSIDLSEPLQLLLVS